VLCTDGEIYGGCNTESAISSLGVCAEMSAMDHAVIHGKYEFQAVCVVDKVLTYPCGACLQYLSLFSQVRGREISVIVADKQGKYRVRSLGELLPCRYLTHSHLNRLKKFKNKQSVPSRVKVW
jgi:cytidine deaminase